MGLFGLDKLIMLLLFVIFTITPAYVFEIKQELKEIKQELKEVKETVREIPQPESLNIVSKVSEEFYRYVTAYNLTKTQTDSTPCIGAWGDNLCQLSNTLNICATNEFPYRTVLLIDGEKYTVLDRTNPRYTKRIDILMDTYPSARQFGIQYLPIKIIEN